MGRDHGNETVVLVVEDDPASRLLCSEAVRSCGYTVVEATSCAEAERQCHAARPHAAILDYHLGDGNALDLMTRLRKDDPHLVVVILTAHGSIDLAVESMRRGADHFLTKPVDPEALPGILECFLVDRQQRRRRRAYDTHRERHRPDPFRGKSAAIRRLERLARKVCASHSPVLLLGETGCGKGVLARWLHDSGPRAAEPFVEVNCAALKPELLESELFGHRKGAFTGATDSKPGLLEIADRGTLFLDEIGDMDLGIQAKLLKVLEEQTFHRLGDVNDRRVDVRLIAATHRDLQEMTETGTFRSDLYFRIHTLPLKIPPLRRRRDDIPSLVDQLLANLSLKQGRPGLGISPRALEVLTSYAWPGNIRELRNVLERAVILGEDKTLDVNNLLFDTGFAGSLTTHTPGPEARRPETRPVERADEDGHRPVRRKTAADVFAALRAELRRRIEQATAAGETLPLGRWVADDLLLAASAVADGCHRRGATLLGISRSTFARGLHRLEAEETPRPAGWDAIRGLLADLLRVPHPPGSDLAAGVRRMMLEEIADQPHPRVAFGAALMGVSEPTFRNWSKTLPSRS